MKKEYPHVSVIILNWNGLEDTLECLESVFHNSYPNYSVYIVDNASEKDELNEIKNFCNEKNPKGPKHLTFLNNPTNLGFAEGNNVAIRKALESETDYIFTLNNDTVVDPNFLSSTIELIQNPHSLNRPNSLNSLHHPNRPIGIISTKMINYYNRDKLDNVGHDLLTTGDTVPIGRNESVSNVNCQMSIVTGQLSHVNRPFGACAGASLYSAKMLKEIGLFDKDFFLNYEDSDLSLRAIVYGWNIIYCPSSIIYHKINRSIAKIKNTSYRIRSQRNQLWAYLHNAPLLAIILNLPWIILRDLSVILVSLITLHWTITKIFICSRYEVLKSLPIILKKRKIVQQHRKISALNFWSRQKSFLTTYLKYFWQIVVKRKKSVM